MEELFIFTTGEVAQYACEFYSKDYHVVGYIDNNPSLAGKLYYELPVCSPDVLKEKKVKVAIANAAYETEIRKQIEDSYDGIEILSFAGDLRKQYEVNQETGVPLEYVICFMGGSLYLYLKNRGAKVYADTSFFLKGNTLSHTKTAINEIVDGFPISAVDENVSLSFRKKGQLYCEPVTMQGNSKSLDTIEQMRCGFIYGYFQFYRAAYEVRNELLQCLNNTAEEHTDLLQVAKELQNNNYISAHFRLGDYNSPANEKLFGGICTEEYYDKAIALMKEKYPDAKFCVFSDDVEYVKNRYHLENASYIQRKMFNDYKDWYDLFLMSCCKHNIIANSSFSWWGAFFNKNEKKEVIAPKKWVNGRDYPDICPKTWIRI